MAWLSLVTVALLFHNPVTGALPLLVFDIIVWALLWIATLLLERVAQVDLLARLNLRNDLVYALRPSMSNRLAEYLALTALGVTAARAVIPIVLGLILALLGSPLFAPLIAWLTTWFAAGVAAQIVAVLTQWSGILIGGLTLFDGSAALASFSLLVLIAGRAFKWEQRYRRELDIRRSQLRRKHEQRSMVIPPTQR